jgi:hypothetical protein
MVVLLVALPSIGGLIGIAIYRRRVPAERRSKGGAFAAFAFGFAGAYAAFYLFSLVRSALDCIGVDFC